MKILVISLRKQSDRREQLRARFKAADDRFTFIDAVDGRLLPAAELFKYQAPLFRATGHLLTPSELGCTLSHIHALTLIRDSGKPALILEDDIEGSLDALDRIEAITNSIVGDFVAICGGQQGMWQRKNIRGTPMPEWGQGLFRLSTKSLSYVWRTCGYAASPGGAVHILNQHAELLRRADEWSVLMGNAPCPTYFADILVHPEELSSSVIQAERNFAEAVRRSRLRRLAGRAKLTAIYSRDKLFYLAAGLRELFGLPGPRNVF